MKKLYFCNNFDVRFQMCGHMHLDWNKIEISNNWRTVIFCSKLPNKSNHNLLILILNWKYLEKMFFSSSLLIFFLTLQNVSISTICAQNKKKLILSRNKNVNIYWNKCSKTCLKTTIIKWIIKLNSFFHLLSFLRRL